MEPLYAVETYKAHEVYLTYAAVLSSWEFQLPTFHAG